MAFGRRERNGLMARGSGIPVHTVHSARRVRRVLGTRTAWTVVGDGEFFCSGCGGDRNYQRLTGRRRFTLLGVPVLPRGETGPVVECAACRRHYGTDALDHPTTVRFSAMLRI